MNEPHQQGNAEDTKITGSSVFLSSRCHEA